LNFTSQKYQSFLAAWCPWGRFHGADEISGLAIKGCKPEPQKILSPQFQPFHERIQVKQFAVALEGVMSVEQNVPPRGRRDLRDQRQSLGVTTRFVSVSSRDRIDEL
jgi:hypothetical protein